MKIVVLPQRLHISSLPNLGFTKAHLYRNSSVPDLESTTGRGTIENRPKLFLPEAKINTGSDTRIVANLVSFLWDIYFYFLFGLKNLVSNLIL